MALVDQPGPDRLGGEVGTAHAEVTSRSPPSSAGPLRGRSRARSASWRWRPSPASWSTRSCRPPARSPRSPAWQGGWSAKVCAVSQESHHLVHPAPVEVGADRPLEVVDEGMHLLVRRSPVEVAVLVRDVAVERRDRRVDQLRHCGRWPVSVLATVSRMAAACLTSGRSAPPAGRSVPACPTALRQGRPRRGRARTTPSGTRDRVGVQPRRGAGSRLPRSTWSAPTCDTVHAASGSSGSDEIMHWRAKYSEGESDRPARLGVAHPLAVLVEARQPVRQPPGARLEERDAQWRDAVRARPRA